ADMDEAHKTLTAARAEQMLGFGIEGKPSGHPTSGESDGECRVDKIEADGARRQQLFQFRRLRTWLRRMDHADRERRRQELPPLLVEARGVDIRISGFNEVRKPQTGTGPGLTLEQHQP